MDAPPKKRLAALRKITGRQITLRSIELFREQHPLTAREAVAVKKVFREIEDHALKPKHQALDGVAISHWTNQRLATILKTPQRVNSFLVFWDRAQQEVL